MHTTKMRRERPRLNRSILELLEPRQLLATTSGSTETDVRWDWTNAGSWIESPITISDAPAGAVATSLSISWKVDAQDLTTADYRLTGPGYTSSTYTNLPYTGEDIFSGYAQTSESTQTITLPANTAVNGTWSFGILESDDWTGMGRIDSWSITITYTTAAPEIQVTGNGYNIADGDMSPITTDNTNFGNAAVGGSSVTKTFVVSNTGAAALTLGTVSVPTGYSITQNLPTSIAAGSSANLIVTLTTTTAGTFAGDISFSNNDANENPFNFRITGAVQASAPEIQVTGNGYNIVDGDTTPSTTDNTNFGTAALGGSSISKTFVVSNTGTGSLTLGSVSVPTGYSVIQNIPTSIAAGGNASLVIALNTTTAGTYAGDISFATNDSDENPFNLRITGIVQNQAPANITLSSSTIQENQPAGTAIGTFSSTDLNPTDTFTYTLVSGTGSTDNASFQIIGNELRPAASFNYEAKSSYSIRVRSTDSGGLYYEKAFTITVTNVNETPTDIALSNASIEETRPVGALVGTLLGTDPDAASSFSYALVEGAGSEDNASFSLNGSSMLSAEVFSLAARTSYSIRLRVTDQGGLSFEKAFTITVVPVNQAPTDITLSASTITENQPSGTAIGTFSTSDPDIGDTFTYTLATGTGSADNATFQIVGSQLRSNAALNFEGKSSYSIRVRGTDRGGLWMERAFTITVLDVNEAPTNLTLSPSSVAENQPAGTEVGAFSTTDPDPGNTYTYSLVAGSGSTDNASLQIVNGTLQTTAVFNREYQFYYYIRVRTTDPGGLYYDQAFTITVTNVNETPMGIALSSTSVDEGRPPGTAVGTFTTSDSDFGDTFTYALVNGAGGDDNANFMVMGSTLNTAAIFSAVAKSSYSIRVRATDAAGAWVERSLGITVSSAGILTSAWSSYLAATVQGIALDANGNAWVTGYTSSPNLGSGGFDTSYNGGPFDAYVAKINANGTIAWSSYLGGSGWDQGYGIALDVSGNAWVAGYTESSGWTTGGFNPNMTGTSDGFVAKINPDGTLAWSSYVGGTSAGYKVDIACDAGGNAWVAGTTYVADKDNEAFVQKINANGTLAWYRYVGGHRAEWGASIVVDAFGNGWLTGTTWNPFPSIPSFYVPWTSGGFDTSYNGGDADAFVAKLNADGTLAWSSYLGGSGQDRGHDIAVDASGNAWVTGSTDSGGWATGGFDTTYNGGVDDAFVARISADVTLAWSSYMGGNGNDQGCSIAVDASGDAWLTGYTDSSGWPSGGLDTTYSPDYGFLAKVHSNGTLASSGYLAAQGYSIALDAGANAWVAEGLFLAMVRYNRAPNAVSLSSSTIAENRPTSTGVGTFSTTDPNSPESFIYTLVTGTGDTDNPSFTIVGNELRTAASFNYETKNSYSIRVRTTDQGGLVFEKAFTITISQADGVAPTVSAVSINNGAAQRSMVNTLTIVFSEPVAIADGALTVVTRTGGSVPNVTVTPASLDQITWELTFGGIGAAGDSLPDGMYNLIASAAGIHDLAGNALTANYTQRFHRLFGDFDGDRDVDKMDLSQFRKALNRPSNYSAFWYFDFDDNDAITSSDYLELKSRMRRSILG